MAGRSARQRYSGSLPEREASSLSSLRGQTALVGQAPNGLQLFDISHVRPEDPVGTEGADVCAFAGETQVGIYDREHAGFGEPRQERGAGYVDPAEGQPIDVGMR